ncbi:MAG: hypothetical protein KA210_00105 [Bacteroidia bacterium]|nr:hypothetical protein [Bacteroidia bacterium]
MESNISKLKGVIFSILFSVFLLIFIGCKKNEPLINSSNSSDDIQSLVVDSLDSTSLQLDNEQVSDDEELKTINWVDGNSYDYYYTEIINVEDTNGEIIPVKIYINNVPVDSDCKTKKCKWCNSTINLVNSYTEEFPNLDNLRENPNRETIGQVMLSLGLSTTSFMSSNSSTGVSIRTVTNTVCEYDEVNGYCSKKCYHEENY